MFALRQARVPLTRAFSTSTALSSFAKITIIGNLAATPEVVATSTGREMVKYALASNVGPKDNKVTSWWNVTSFAQEGNYREFLTGLPKGTLMFVEGDASMATYQDAEGKNRSALNIVERKIDVLKRPDERDSEH